MAQPEGRQNIGAVAVRPVPSSGVASQPSPFLPPASVDEPRLLTFDREVLTPVVRLGQPVDPELDPASFVSPEVLETDASQDVHALLARAEAAAAEEEPAAPQKPASPAPKPLELVTDENASRVNFGSQRTRKEVEFKRARTFFEELAMMSLMRKPDPGDQWRNLRPVEERLLARVDGIVACGVKVFPELVKILEERPLPDPELLWAAIFLHGSLAGDDALDQVARLIDGIDLEEPEIRASISDALAFAPHPGIEGIVRPWLRSPNAWRRAIAQQVLARRRSLSVAEAMGGVRDADEGVVIEAAQGLWRTPGPLPGNELGRLLTHANESVVRGALDAAFVWRSDLGLRQAAGLTTNGKGEFAQAAIYLSIGAGIDAFDALRGALATTGPAVVLEALGWFGHPSAVDVLLDRLTKGEVAAVGPLQRITGASLTDEDPDPSYAKGEEPFGRVFVPPPPELILSEKPEVWTAWWAKHRARANLRARYRFGHLWTPQDNLWELMDSYASPTERMFAYLELVARTGGTLPFDPLAFVATQERQLEAWRGFLSARAVTPGSWPSALHR